MQSATLWSWGPARGVQRQRGSPHVHLPSSIKRLVLHASMTTSTKRPHPCILHPPIECVHRIRKVLTWTGRTNRAQRPRLRQIFAQMLQKVNRRVFRLLTLSRSLILIDDVPNIYATRTTVQTAAATGLFRYSVVIHIAFSGVNCFIVLFSSWCYY